MFISIFNVLPSKLKIGKPSIYNVDPPIYKSFQGLLADPSEYWLPILGTRFPLIVIFELSLALISFKIILSVFIVPPLTSISYSGSNVFIPILFFYYYFLIFYL